MSKKSSKSSSSRSPKHDSADLKELLSHYVRTRGTKFLRDPNVTSVGIGRKNGQISLVFTVRVKAEASALETAWHPEATGIN